MKKKHTGDGGSFYTAVSKSGMNNEDIQAAMRIGNGTFYRLYKKQVFTTDEKQAAANALNRSVEDIFGAVDDIVDGPVKNTPLPGEPNIADSYLSSQLINTQSDMNQLLTALNRMAETDLIHAKNYERLISLLEDRQQGRQRPGATGS